MRRTALAALALVLLAAPAPAAAAPGDYTITYDWAGTPGTGYAGWQEFALPEDGYPGFQTPFYRVDIGAAGAGIAFAPVPAADGTRDRVYPLHPEATNAIDGVMRSAVLGAPGTTRITRATFSAIDYRRATDERQFLRLATYGPGADGVYDTRPDAPAPGPFVNDTTYTNVGPVVVDDPGDDADSVQTWIFTSCDPTCPTVRFDGPGATPRSQGRVGRVVVDLEDSENPDVTIDGALGNGGWTNGRDARSARIVATDPGAGVRRVQAVRRRTGGGTVNVLTADAPCDRSHTTNPPGPRTAAPCPERFETTLTQDLAGLPNGEYTYTVTVTDDSDRTTVRTFVLRIDRTPPTAGLGGALRRLPRDWLRRADGVPASLQESDGQSGVQALELYADEGGATRRIGTVAVCPGGASACPRRAGRSSGVDLGALADGDVAVYARAVDLAGNASRASTRAKLKLDRRPPSSAGGLKAFARRRTLTARWNPSTDPGKGSGLRRYRVRVTDRSTFRSRLRTINLPAGRRMLEVRLPAGFTLADTRVLVTAEDRAGNVSRVSDAGVQIVKRPGRRVRKPVRRTGRRRSVPLKPRTIQFGFSDGSWEPYTEATVRNMVGRLRAYQRRNKRRPTPSFVSVRALMPYDAWNQTDPRFRNYWKAFAIGLADYNAHRGTKDPEVKAYVTLMAHNFEKCPAPREVGFVEGVDPGPCSYPTVAAYGDYLRQWVRQASTAEGDRPAVYVDRWGAWNEPDNQMFTLAGLGTVAGARRAADYWVAAQRTLAAETDGKALCAGCQAVAGEFSTYVADWVQVYEQRVRDTRGGTAPPRIWSLHAYGDLFPRASRRDAIANYVGFLRANRDRDKLGNDFSVWVTEIGTLLQFEPTDRTLPGKPPKRTFNPTVLDGKATQQFNGGRDLMRIAELDPLIDRIYYYDARASTNDFDSALTDAAGTPRPVMCGMGGEPNRKTCKGNPTSPKEKR